jgi:hypothetical protein
VYIVHLLVCLLSEDVQNDETSPQRRNSRYNHIMRLVSFGIIAVVLVSRYVLALSLQRGLFFLSPSWASWLGLTPSIVNSSSMSFSEYFLYDFIIVLVSFFYQRQVFTSSRYSCVKSDNSNYDARPLTLGEYASFAVVLLQGANDTTVDKSRFSFFDIYRQFCLNYDRISGFTALFVLVYATIENVPSLTNLALILSITLILTQFETRTHRNKMKRMFKNDMTCGYQCINCSFCRAFVVVGQHRCGPLIVCVYHHAVSYFGPWQHPLGCHHYVR